eukprot:scaffold77401_cov20-Tisochrysis_lutea.AAC.1
MSKALMMVRPSNRSGWLHTCAGEGVRSVTDSAGWLLQRAVLQEHVDGVAPERQDMHRVAAQSPQHEVAERGGCTPTHVWYTLGQQVGFLEA